MSYQNKQFVLSIVPTSFLASRKHDVSFESSLIVGLPTLPNGYDDYVVKLVSWSTNRQICPNPDDTMTCAVRFGLHTFDESVVCGSSVGVVFGLTPVLSKLYFEQYFHFLLCSKYFDASIIMLIEF